MTSSSTPTTNNLPETHRALRQETYAEPPTVQTIPTPQCTPGSAVVRVLAADVVSYMKEIYDGTRKYPYPTPLTLGNAAIARVAAVGNDATFLKPGQLVFVDITVRSRDRPTDVFLSAFFEGDSEGSRKLMHGEWRDGTFAEYAKVPLENCYAMDEERLLGPVSSGGLGYTVDDLLAMARMLVPYGGLVDIGLRPGQTVIVAPATGGFGGAAVHVALALGAGKVIAMGRNEAQLKRVAEGNPRVVTVRMTGDLDEEVKTLTSHGPIDVFFDISPPQAAKSTHFKAAILALKHSGKVSMMGGQREDVPIPHGRVMHWNLTLKGKWMFEREDVWSMIQLIQTDTLKLKGAVGQSCIGSFSLADWQKAFDLAMEEVGRGFVVLRP